VVSNEAKTSIYIYILYNVPKQKNCTQCVRDGVSQMFCSTNKFVTSQDRSISLFLEHWNIALFSSTYRHTRWNNMEQYRTLHKNTGLDSKTTFVLRKQSSWQLYILVVYCRYNRNL